MGGNTLEKTPVVNDLGVQIDNHLNWDTHIDRMAKKASSKMWLLIRNMGFNAPFKAKKSIFIALVRSTLEYCSVIWSPHCKDQMTTLERIQQRATNYITSNPKRPSEYHVDYKTRLLRCNLLPLSYRREILDIIFFLKSYNGDTGYNVRDYVEFSDQIGGANTRQRTQGCYLRIINPKVTANSIYKDQFYPERVVRIWNSLPYKLQESLRPLKSNLVIKQHINPYYYFLLENVFDPENTCTWISFCRCPRCRQCR